MDAVITLIKEGAATYDEYGNEMHTTTEREIMCQVFGVTRSEFYQAAVNDLQPELIVRISEAVDYEGETLARYENVLYSVIRVYRNSGSLHHGRAGSNALGLNAIELTLQRKVGDVDV